MLSCQEIIAVTVQRTTALEGTDEIKPTVLRRCEMKDEAVGDGGGRSFEDYQAGLEDSIRRCEELLACTPLTFLPPRRGSERKSLRDSVSVCSLFPDIITVDSSTTIPDSKDSIIATERRHSDSSDKRHSTDIVSMSSSFPEVRSEEEKKSEVSQSVLIEDRSETTHEDKNVAPNVLSFTGDEVEIIIEADAKEEQSQVKSQLKFCPLDDKPPRRAHRSKSAPKENMQFKNTTDFFNAITEVMDNLKSYIHMPPVSPDNNASKKERLKNLSKPRTEFHKRLAEVKQIIEDKQLKECSFKPAVRKKNDSGNNVPVLERLTEAQQQREIRKIARKVSEKEELAACSFRPQINHKSPYYDRNGSQPLPERFKELERRRRERLEKAMKEQEHHPFKPELNPKSVQLFKQSGLETVDLQERLVGGGHSVHADCKYEIEARKSTFAPEINPNTDDIIACSKQFGGLSADFFTRQQRFLGSLQEKKQKQKENEVPRDFTFTPNIGNAEFILKQAMCGEIFPETAEERVQRLAYKDKANQMQVRKKISDEYYGQFNFHPEIDEVSRLVGRTSTIKDLYMNAKSQELKKELEQAAEADFQQKCPFRPMTYSSHEVEKIRFRSHLLERLHARKDPYPNCLQESWTMKELEEIKECTFKPMVNRLRPKDAPPALIKGLDRHLELQQIAKQMKKDQEDYEKKVFFSHVSSLPIRQYTIPKPFSFTEHYKSDMKPGSPEP